MVMTPYFPVGKMTNILIRMMCVIMQFTSGSERQSLSQTDNWALLRDFFFSAGKQKCRESGSYFPIFKVSTSEIIPVGFIL